MEKQRSDTLIKPQPKAGYRYFDTSQEEKQCVKKSAVRKDYAGMPTPTVMLLTHYLTLNDLSVLALINI